MLYVSDILNPGGRFIMSGSPDATFPVNKLAYSQLRNTLEEVKVPKRK